MTEPWTVASNPLHYRRRAGHHFHLQRQPLARHRRRPRSYPQRYQPSCGVGRGDRPGRSLGLRQIDPADDDGGAGASRSRRGGGRRHADQCPRRGCAGALPRPASRHRVPVLPPRADHDGAGERRDAARTCRRPGRASTGPTPNCAVGLGDRLHHYPAQLSGGEQQRVAIARAIAPDPAHPRRRRADRQPRRSTGRSIVDLLFALQRERGATLVLVTHDQSRAQRATAWCGCAPADDSSGPGSMTRHPSEPRRRGAARPRLRCASRCASCAAASAASASSSPASRWASRRSPASARSRSPHATALPARAADPRRRRGLLADPARGEAGGAAFLRARPGLVRPRCAPWRAAGGKAPRWSRSRRSTAPTRGSATSTLDPPCRSPTCSPSATAPSARRPTRCCSPASISRSATG